VVLSGGAIWGLVVLSGGAIWGLVVLSGGAIETWWCYLVVLFGAWWCYLVVLQRAGGAIWDPGLTCDRWCSCAGWWVGWRPCCTRCRWRRGVAGTPHTRCSCQTSGWSRAASARGRHTGSTRGTSGTRQAIQKGQNKQRSQISGPPEISTRTEHVGEHMRDNGGLLCTSTGPTGGTPWPAGGRTCGSPYHRRHTPTFWCLRLVVWRGVKSQVHFKKLLSSVVKLGHVFRKKKTMQI